MQPKNLFPKFWRQQSEAAGPEKSVPMEAAVNKSTPSAEAVAPHAHLLTYEDIYHAAGILSPTSGYGIPKLSEMLNSERIRDLSKDVKRASILMALDASGTSVDDVLQDATRRQNALDTYETAQRRQLEEFEARKAQENAQIEAEMERLKAHYTERIQRNHDAVELQREALRNWRMATQNESQRISEVIDICQKPGISASAAAASAGGERKSSDTLSAESRNLRPSLITRD